MKRLQRDSLIEKQIAASINTIIVNAKSLVCFSFFMVSPF